MKKFATLAAAAVLAFTLSACDVEDDHEWLAGDVETSNPRTEDQPKPTKAEPVEVEPVEVEPVEKKTEKPKPSLTAGQEQALRSAESYLDFMAFSKQGLIDQLSSEYGEGFSVKDATFAANNVNADWMEQAAKSAKSYLDMMPFSRQGLIDQLSSAHGEKFTLEQATYGVNQAGL